MTLDDRCPVVGFDHHSQRHADDPVAAYRELRRTSPVAWTSANRDEHMFEHLDDIDIDRWPNRHTAFGIGMHRCAGSQLARTMARSVLGQVLERMPDYEIDTTKLQRYPDQGTNGGSGSIPATFTPGPRRRVDAL